MIIKPRWLEEIHDGKDYEIRRQSCKSKIGKRFFFAASGSFEVCASAFMVACHGPLSEKEWELTRARHRVPGPRFYGTSTYAWEISDVKRHPPVRIRRNASVIWQTGPE